jgi:hypothetical protein
MTAVSPVSPGQSTSPGFSGSQRIWVVSQVPATGPFAPKVTWTAVAGALSAIAGVLAASLPPDAVTTAKIATPAGVTEVHHG